MRHLWFVAFASLVGCADDQGNDSKRKSTKDKGTETGGATETEPANSTGTGSGGSGGTASGGGTSAPVTVDPYSKAKPKKTITEGEGGGAALFLVPGDTQQIELSFDGVSDGSVTFESSDPSVSTVDDKGNVTAVGPGTTIILAKVDANGTKFTVRITIRVSDANGVAPSSAVLAADASVAGKDKPSIVFTWPDGAIWAGLSDGKSFAFKNFAGIPEWGPVFRAGSPARTMVGDFNGDGKQDYAFAWPDGNWWIGASDGNKLNFTLYAQTAQWGEMFRAGSLTRTFVGDWNGDGKSDVAFAHVDGSIWLGTSNGVAFAFTEAYRNPAWAAQFSASSKERFFVMDLNGDKKDDLVMVSSDGAVWGGVSNGSAMAFSEFYRNANWATVFADGSPARFFVGDWNGDQKTDLAFAWNDGALWYGLSNGASMSFVNAIGKPEWGAIFASTSPARFFVNDFNGDAKSDIAFAWPDGNVWVGVSTGTTIDFRIFAQEKAWSGVFDASSAARFFSADFNSDNNADIAFLWPDGNIWVGVSNGSAFDFQLWAQVPSWGEVFRAGSGARMTVASFLGGAGNARSVDDEYIAPTPPVAPKPVAPPAPAPVAVPVLPPPPPPPPPSRAWDLTIHEGWNAKWGVHMFSATPNEGVDVGFAPQAPRFRALQPGVGALACSGANAVAISRASHPIADAIVFNFDTWDAGHRVLINEQGWTNNGNAFSVACAHEPGTVPLHKWIGPNADRFLSIDPGAAAGSGYQYIGVMGFVMPP